MNKELFTCDSSGLDDLADDLAGVDTVIKISMNDGLRKIGKILVPAKGSGPLADETPRGKGSPGDQYAPAHKAGSLRRSTIFQIIGNINNPRLEVRQGARSASGIFYGAIVRDGRGPVVPRKKKFLRFWNGSRWVFTKYVKATKPNRYHKRVLDRNRSKIQQAVNEIGGQVTAYIAGK